MAEDSLILEHLRAIRAEVASVWETLADHGQRLNGIEQGIAGVRRDPASDAENVAHQNSRLDRLADRIDRIERRLEVTDG